VSRGIVHGRCLASFALHAGIALSARAQAADPPATGELTLDEARARALERGPEALGAAARLAAAEGAFVQARALPNPDLTFEVEDFGGNLPADPPSQQTLSIGQRVEWFGKRSARVASARLERDVTDAARALAQRWGDATGSTPRAAARLEQARRERRADEARLRAACRTALEALAHAAREVRILNESVLPNARLVYDAVGEGYRRGKFRLLELLEARRNLASVRLRTVEARTRLTLALADVRRLTPPEPPEGKK